MKNFLACLAVSLAAVFAVLASGCASVAPDAPPPPKLQCLRVGFAPDYPPLCMLDADGNPDGLEADFAAALADELECPFEIVRLDFKDLFPALLDRRVDILMSGITVTPSRAYDVRFCKPYMVNPLVAVTRAGWAHSYNSASQVLSTAGFVGVLRHTYSETFVRRRCPRARIVPVSSYEEVPKGLGANAFTIYIDDLAAAMDLAARYPALVEIIRYPLQQQETAWAVHPDDAALLSAANAAIDKWKANGRLKTMLDSRLPEWNW